LDKEIKPLKHQEEDNLRQEAVGVEFGNSAHLLDAANSIKLCWAAITHETIIICFN
jgi:hypothetical protein